MFTMFGNGNRRIVKELIRNIFRNQKQKTQSRNYFLSCSNPRQFSVFCKSTLVRRVVWCSPGFRQRTVDISSSCCNSKSIDHEIGTDVSSFDGNFDDLFEEQEFKPQVVGHNVFVVQPYVKWGPSKKELTTPDFQLDESVALIDTLKYWKVVGKEKVPLMTTKMVKVFGTGKLEALTKIIRSDESVTAVFVSLNSLSKDQQDFLEQQFGVPVFDRYSVVIEIFREHAVTKEAKLQVAMAEIPQLRRKLSLEKCRVKGDSHSIGGSGETIFERRKNMLNEREKKIKLALKNLKNHRELIRSKRKKRQFPTVAVVGYTNAGKTSLIKALTQEEQMEPKNELFATLDVTCHCGLLPSNIKVLYIDTIGFISDIPTLLIEPFIVTLEDALEADLIVHIVDVSNPDHFAQSTHVSNTLRRLNVEKDLLNNVIVVANKVDLLPKDQLTSIADDGMIQISCVTNTGLQQLREEVEKALLQITERTKLRIRVTNGGPEFTWLYKESSVVNVLIDENDGQFIFMDVVITNTNLDRFKFEFITSKKRERLKRSRD